jgi:hypothetical protein
MNGDLFFSIYASLFMYQHHMYYRPNRKTSEKRLRDDP